VNSKQKFQQMNSSIYQPQSSLKCVFILSWYQLALNYSQGLLSSIENTFKVCGKMLPTEKKVLRGSELKKIFLFFANKDSSLAARFVDEIANQLEANR
jgi:hypothetical protein